MTEQSEQQPALEERLEQPVPSQDTTESPQDEAPAESEQAVEDDDAAESDEEAALADGEQQEDGKKSWKERRQERSQKRLEEYRRQRREQLRLQRETLPTRLSALEQEVQRLREMSPPDLDEIDDPDERTAAAVLHRVERRDAERRLDALRQEAEAEMAQVKAQMQEVWEVTAAEARLRIPDFDAVVTSQTPIHERAAPFILESEKAAEIAYFLGKNPEIANQLYDAFDANPARALVALGKIEAFLSVPRGRQPTKAPPPPTTVAGGRSPSSFDPNKADIDDMAAYLRKKGIIR